MIDKIDANQIRETIEKAAAQLPDTHGASVRNQADASLQTDFASLVENAGQPPQTDALAVRRARELLDSGQLDTPQNIRAAAQNIVDYGI
jgi:hypothetical protein